MTKPRFTYPPHLALLRDRAEEADRLYSDALDAVYRDRGKLATLYFGESDAILARRRCLTHRNRPELLAARITMQRLTDEWIEAHVDHYFRLGYELIGSRVTPVTPVTPQIDETEKEA